MNSNLFAKYNALELSFSTDTTYKTAKDMHEYIEEILLDPSVDEKWTETLISNQLLKLSCLINTCNKNEREKWIQILLEKISYFHRKYSFYYNSNEKLNLLSAVSNVMRFTRATTLIDIKFKKEQVKILEYESLYHALKKNLNSNFVLLQPIEITEEIKKIEQSIFAR